MNGRIEWEADRAEAWTDGQPAAAGSVAVLLRAWKETKRAKARGTQRQPEASGWPRRAAEAASAANDNVT